MKDFIIDFVLIPIIGAALGSGIVFMVVNFINN